MSCTVATMRAMTSAIPMLNMTMRTSATGASSHCHVMGSPVISRMTIMMGIA